MSATAIERAVEDLIIASIGAGDPSLSGRAVNAMSEDEAAPTRIVVEAVEDSEDLGGNRPRGLGVTVTIHQTDLDDLFEDRANVIAALDTVSDPNGVFGYYRSHHDEMVRSDPFTDGKSKRKFGIELKFDVWAALASTAPEQVSGITPEDEATDVAITGTTIEWSAARGATSYVVRFGTANPPPIVVASTAKLFYNPGTLVNSTVYRIRIDAVNAQGTTTGAVQSFTTAASLSLPAQVAILTPEDAETGVDCIGSVVRWGAASGATGYDVYLDAVDGTTLVSSNQAGLTYSLPRLLGGTTYHLRVDARNANGVTAGVAQTFRAFIFTDITRVALSGWFETDYGIWQDASKTVPCSTLGDEAYWWMDKRGASYFQRAGAGTSFKWNPSRGNAGSQVAGALVSNGTSESMNGGGAGTPLAAVLAVQYIVMAAEYTGNWTKYEAYWSATAYSQGCNLQVNSRDFRCFNGEIGIDGVAANKFPDDTRFHVVCQRGFDSGVSVAYPTLGKIGGNYGRAAWQAYVSFVAPLTIEEDRKVRNYLRAKYATD